ncbi:MAG: ATP-dependent DNA helicase [Alphaproteobacteria bacterium]
MEPQQLDFSGQFSKALEAMEDGDKHIFLTGNAGTGKSTLLNHFRKTTKKNIAVLAPTGVAAVNVKGQTIHSFFKFRPDITPDTVRRIRRGSGQTESIYRKLDAIIIDEVSMVRADLMDCIDKFLRLNAKNRFRPFGGIRMIFVGDLYQLPPVVTRNEEEVFKARYKSPYFFSSHILQEISLEHIELDKIYRQSNTDFVSLLNNIRNDTVTSDQLEVLNKRVLPIPEDSGDDAFYVHLTTTNRAAKQVNDHHLDKLMTPEHTFEGNRRGKFEQSYLPVADSLRVKTGAQVMLANNDPEGRWINGTMGKVQRIIQHGNDDVVVVKLESGKTVDVMRHKWDIFKFVLEDENVTSESVGSYSQYPLILAWAITIHKSQGKTFEQAVIDFSTGTFSAGQAYVALSRCTSLEGITLKRPLVREDIWIEPSILAFTSQMKTQEISKQLHDLMHQGKDIEIDYIKADDSTCTLILKPKSIEMLKHNDTPYQGLRAFSEHLNAEKVFRLDKITSWKEAV